MLNKTPPKHSSTTVSTPKFRMSYPALIEPRQDPSGRLMFGVTMLFPPKTDLRDFRTALDNAVFNKFGPDKSRWPRMRRGVKDVMVDFADYNERANKPLPGDWSGWTMIRANAKAEYPPKVVGPVYGPDDKFPVIIDKREVFGGRWARAIVDAYYFKVPGNDGLTFGLQQVQLLMRDTPFGMARASSEEAFTEMPDEYDGEDDRQYEEIDTTAKKDNRW